MASQSNGLNYLHTFIIEEMRKKARELALKSLLRAQDDHLLGLETFLCPQKGVSVKVGLFVYSFSKCIYFICP